MNIFLRAKHWQLFLLTFGLPFLIEIIFMLKMFVTIASGRVNGLDMGAFTLFPIIMLLCMGTMFGWFWSVAIGLQSKIPQNINMKVTLFKVFFFIPLVYLIGLCCFIGSTFGTMVSIGGQPNQAIFSLFMLIVPLHLFSMLCIFYCLYFVAKTIKTVELQREVTFSDFAGEFFMIWFFFIGVWIIQPRINKIVAEDNSPDPDSIN